MCELTPTNWIWVGVIVITVFNLGFMAGVFCVIWPRKDKTNVN